VTLSYAVRLVCLSLACFFLVHLLAGLAVSATASRAVRFADRMNARSAARFLLLLRLLPVGFALYMVGGLCVPGYLWLEPDAEPENAGVVCIAAAILGLGIWGISIGRSLRAMASSARYLKLCRGAGMRRVVNGENILTIDARGHFVQMAGIFRPKLIVTADVVRALSAEELETSLRHELAHGRSFDNFKRLLMLLSPDVAPWCKESFATLERNWARFAEWAADDEAVAGDAEQSVVLASALVKVAKMGGAADSPVLVASLVADDLAARVERLLHPETVTVNQSRELRVMGMAVAAGCAIMLHPLSIAAVHEVLEFLMN
jgi:beta-lactamase regulating signal transducer with metallopeptidase domain